MMTMMTGVLITKECVVLESHCYAVLLSSAFHVDAGNRSLPRSRNVDRCAVWKLN